MTTRQLLNLTIVAALMALPFVGAPVPVAAQSGTEEITPDMLYVPGEVIVGFPKGQPPDFYTEQAFALAGSVGAQVVDSFANVALMQFAEDADVHALAAQISSKKGIAYAEPNYLRWIPEYLVDPTAAHKDRWVNAPHPRAEVTFRFKDSKTDQEREVTLSLNELRSMKRGRRGLAVPSWPTDPMLWDQWGWDYSSASIIWTDKTSNPMVCVIDTGVDGGHPDLKGRVQAGYDFVNDDTKPDDDNGHGTHVSGTISALTSNGIGFAGISTAKILAVKVLSAQGWGTSFDVAQGIVYCANNSNVKVISMSLGGYGAGLAEYNALDYAINTRGKLVVAAAGNSSAYRHWWFGELHFPSAWAVEWVCKDGTDNYPTDCSGANDNALAPGLISVGAAQPPWGEQWHDANEDGLLWVDVNGDGNEPADTDPDYWDEHFRPEECAADFSNYGAWVEMVAPGEEIISTQPVSYNFHNRYFWGADSDGDGYEWYSGTSMATPHVAGGAARAWSVFPTETNVQIAARLQNALGWNPMAFAMDPNMIDPEAGYNGGYNGEAPYCWPDDTYGGKYDMSAARYLNVAGAMERYAFWQAVSDAVTGLPLEKATVTAYVGFSSTVRDKSVITRNSRWAALLNLVDGTFYNFKVNKSGYTSGDVDIDPYIWSCDAGWNCGLPPIAIPPMGRISAVANWWFGGDLDLYAWLPNVSSAGGVVGAWEGIHPLGLGPGTLLTFPYARWNRDGGAGDWLSAESISIKPKAGSSTIPYYNLTANDYYDFLLTDYGSGDLNQPLFLRVWAGGKITGYVGDFSPSCDTDGPDDIPGNADDEIWWYAGRLNFGTFTPFDSCVSNAGLPY